MVKNSSALVSSDLSLQPSIGIAESTVPAVRESILAVDTTVQALSGCSVELSPCLQLKLAETDSPYAVTGARISMILDAGTPCLGERDMLQIKGPAQSHIKAVCLELQEACGHRTVISNDRGNFIMTRDGFEIKHLGVFSFEPSAIFRRAA